MPATALALALGAAVLHAGWNVLLARSRDVRAATTVALVVGVVLFAPFAAATWRVEEDAIPWIVASAILELAYFFLLTAAYRRSDLSLVYPIARGAAPVLVLVGARSSASSSARGRHLVSSWSGWASSSFGASGARPTVEASCSPS